MANAPDRFELFILGEGEKKVEMKPDTRSPNTAIFTFNKEDHTLGNLLRSQLAKNDDVLFVAYKVPHPLFATFDLRVQTTENTTPKDAVVNACKALIGELTNLRNNMTREFELKRMAQDENLR
ncbi:DNA-directed RNA polymerase [Kalaharituber pfeilii]|nr:DNA-directed RNA polymerase [Kalaharituber pfeilii]